MLLAGSSFRSYYLFTFFAKTPLMLFRQSSHAHRPILQYPSFISVEPIYSKVNCFFMSRASQLSTSVLTARVTAHESPTGIPIKLSNKAKRKANRESPERVLQHKLGTCSKHGDVVEALRLYDGARSEGVRLNQHHYNVLLYLCSSSYASGEPGSGEKDVKILNLWLKRGFEIFQQMGIDKIAPNEATLTSAARLAAAAEDPEMAFDLVKKMVNFDIPPKLRSYGPALFGFCKKGEAEKAYEVDAHMIASGVVAEEPELSALLKLSANSVRGDRVYQMLHRLRATVRQVSESTADIVEEWFNSCAAAEIGEENWDVSKVKDGVVKGGGGWHGQGWLGKGRWRVVRSEMDETGVCRCCGEKLVCIDIDPLETQNFARSLSKLACQKEARLEFNCFQEWLLRHGPFDAVIDGANVGLINQRTFSFPQLHSVVNRVRQMSPSKKLPLIILHNRRVKDVMADNPNKRRILENWQKAGSLYATPRGSNDDWYWLYAAVSCKCLLVSNDEMRDHLFELLGTSFFPRWKEKHQVRLSISRRGPTLHMPPPYSIVIQESEKGSWHVPTVIGDDIENPRQWVCATRASTTSSS